MTTSNAGEDAEEIDHSFSAGVKVKWYITMVNSLIVCYKTKHATTIQSHNSTLAHLSQKYEKVMFTQKSVHEFS